MITCKKRKNNQTCCQVRKPSKVARLCAFSAFSVLVFLGFVTSITSITLGLTATSFAAEQSSVDQENQANASQLKLVWDKRPLNIVLPVGVQRMISFPEKVALGLPQDAQNLFEVQNDNKTLYITAKQSFAPQQFVIRTQSNRVILVNLSAQDKASHQMIDVIYPKVIPVDQNNDDDHVNEAVSLKALLRYSMQHYYAPKRLLHPVRGISESMRFNGKSYALFPSGIVMATPLVSFTGGGLTVTAIYLKNAVNLPVDLNPNEICGTWKASSFFPQSRLLPSGSRYDSSMLFLVSNNDFISQYNGTCSLSSSASISSALES
ncbi:TIGR03749 family integrating conjugative element protein [Cysteiniphilum litorale]|uniref:TIGR03749 family integrating conjugative element protein n=1 Tax=Cysteiniphilum litorale TaxID=2056700 RepID=UPI003F882DCA